MSELSHRPSTAAEASFAMNQFMSRQGLQNIAVIYRCLKTRMKVQTWFVDAAGRR
jgi:hypothetical protein